MTERGPIDQAKVDRDHLSLVSALIHEKYPLLTTNAPWGAMKGELFSDPYTNAILQVDFLSDSNYYTLPDIPALAARVSGKFVEGFIKEGNFISTHHGRHVGMPVSEQTRYMQGLGTSSMVFQTLLRYYDSHFRQSSELSIGDYVKQTMPIVVKAMKLSLNQLAQFNQALANIEFIQQDGILTLPPDSQLADLFLQIPDIPEKQDNGLTVFHSIEKSDLISYRCPALYTKHRLYLQQYCTAAAVYDLLSNETPDEYLDLANTLNISLVASAIKFLYGAHRGRNIKFSQRRIAAEIIKFPEFGTFFQLTESSNLIRDIAHFVGLFDIVGRGFAHSQGVDVGDIENLKYFWDLWMRGEKFEKWCKEQLGQNTEYTQHIKGLLNTRSRYGYNLLGWALLFRKLK